MAFWDVLSKFLGMAIFFSLTLCLELQHFSKSPFIPQYLQCVSDALQTFKWAAVKILAQHFQPSLHSLWPEITNTGTSFIFVDVLGWPIAFCLLGPSSIANCNAAAGSSSGSVQSRS